MVMPSLADTLARRVVAPVIRQVRLLISRGVVELVNDSLKCQGLQVSLLADELRDNVERFEDYGMTSHPFIGAEVLYLSVGGNRSLGVAVRVLDRRYRPKSMGEGDVCLFTDKGERVYIESSSDIVNLGAKSASDFVAKASIVDSRLDALESFAASHTHGGVTAGAAFTATAVGAPSGSSTAASKVKAT
jgi:phage baseplate assembly protein V